MRRFFPLIVSCAALLAGCATEVNPVTGQHERTVMDERARSPKARKAHEQVLPSTAPTKTRKLQAYVNELGQRLAKQSHRAQLEWHFTVLDSPEINAFALPGGYVYVTRGIMAYMESEADLAGVIGHEIGHVTARHGSQRATSQQTAGVGVLAATILGAVLEGGRRRRRHAGGSQARKASRRATSPSTAASRSRRPTGWAPNTWRAATTTREHGRCDPGAEEPGTFRRRRSAGRRPPAPPKPTGSPRTRATTSGCRTSRRSPRSYQASTATTAARATCRPSTA